MRTARSTPSVDRVTRSTGSSDANPRRVIFPLIEKRHIALAVDAAVPIGHRIERGGIVDAARKNCHSRGVFPE